MNKSLQNQALTTSLARQNNLNHSSLPKYLIFWSFIHSSQNPNDNSGLLKKCLSIAFVILAQWVFGQLIIKPIVPESGSQRSDKTKDELVAIALPFWDDFSSSGDVPDTLLWEFSTSVFINEAIAIDPPTFKAATFDGLDEFGQLYSEDSEFPSLTDQLISRQIDLGNLVGDETIHLSFFWEAGGNGEMPEGADSLRLQFLNADSVWVTEWKMRADNAPTNDSFTQVILKVDSEYRHGDFRFRFESFGSLQGPFDTWHVDYVYLDNGRNLGDLTYLDRAFTGTLSSLISPYREMPSAHFFADPSKYIEPQKFQASNLDVTPHTLDLDYNLVNTESGSVFNFNDDGNIFLPGELKEITLAQQPSIGPDVNAPDSVVFVATLTSNFSDPIAPINYRINDTIRAQYTFQNHYAYDDGVAEFAAGVRQDKGSIAVLYVLETADTLSHIDIYFPSISPSSAGSSIDVNVWKQLDAPGSISSRNHTISSSGRNEFTRIQLASPRVVQDSIYIGFTQNTSEYVGVGVDRSNLPAKDRAYFQTSGDWQPNSLVNGVLMIRPVFDSSDFVLGSEIPTEKVTFYPNPTNGDLIIPGKHSAIQVLSLGGKILIEEKQKTKYDLSALKSGIYLLRIMDERQATKIFKLLRK